LEAIRAIEDVVAFSLLGIGAGTAKLTIDQHRAVDVQLNVAFARGLQASGRVKHLAFMSAAGANPTAATTGSGAAGMPRYARVKGEAEEAVKAAGPAVVSIFRPAMIIGSRHTPRLLEKVLPAFSFVTPTKYKSITVEQIAKAMIAASYSGNGDLPLRGNDGESLTSPYLARDRASPHSGSRGARVVRTPAATDSVFAWG
jgi:uncharacterized protein YbjT (DUF2867 family)